MWWLRVRYRAGRLALHKRRHKHDMEKAEALAEQETADAVVELIHLRNGEPVRAETGEGSEMREEFRSAEKA